MNCPFCAEEIKDEANVCKHCGRDLIAIRPLLEANQSLAKRVDALQQDLDKLAEAQLCLHRHAGLSGSKVPSIHRGSAIALLLVWIFVVGLFIAAVVKQHGVGLSPIYATSTLILVPLVFGFLCQNVRTRPSGSDFGLALLVTGLAVVEIQLIRWELLAGSLIPQGWELGHADGDLPPDSWSTLMLNAATIFLGFSAGVFFRYFLQMRHHGEDAPVTLATPVSTFIVGRLGGKLSPAEFEEKIKRTDALIHSLTGIGAAGGAIVTYLVAHVHSTVG